MSRAVDIMSHNPVAQSPDLTAKRASGGALRQSLQPGSREYQQRYWGNQSLLSSESTDEAEALSETMAMPEVITASEVVVEPQTFAELRRNLPVLATALTQIAGQLNALIRRIEMSPSWPAVSHTALLYNLARARFLDLSETNKRKDRYDLYSVNEWLAQCQRVLQHLAHPLAEMVNQGGLMANRGCQWDAKRQKLLEAIQKLLSRIDLQQAAQQRLTEHQRATEQRPIDAAIKYIQDYLENIGWDALDKGDLRLHGVVVATTLFHKMHLSSKQIHKVLDQLNQRSPLLLDAALFGGSTVDSLLTLGVGGLQAYRTRGEGFLAGVRRGSRESALAQGVEKRRFNILDLVIAYTGFQFGAGKGVLEALRLIT